MRVSAIKSYDYVHKNNNGPQQPCPAPMPYATNPNFKASASQAVTGLKSLGKKILGFVAAMGLVSNMAIQRINGQQQVDSPYKLNISVKGNDGKTQQKVLGLADDATYLLNLNGKEYVIALDESFGTGIFDESLQDYDALPMNKEQYNVMQHLAAVDGKPNELSAKDVQLVNTKNLNLPNYRVKHLQNKDMKQGETDISIEQIKDGKTVSHLNVNILTY